MALDPVKGNITHPGTLNGYAYVVNNPLKYTDPLGESFITDIWGSITDAAVRTLEAAKLRIDEALQKIKVFIDENKKHFNEPSRYADLSNGVAVSLVKPLLDTSAIGVTVALEILTLFTKTEDVFKLYNNYNQNINKVLDYLASNARYPDSFYFGRTIGDIVVMAVGVYGGVDGIYKIIEGLGLGKAGIAGGAAVSATGVGAPVGAAVIGGSLAGAGALIGAGAIELGVGIALVAAGGGNLGGDFDNFKYFNQLDCDAGKFITNWSCGREPTPKENLLYHFKKHGGEVGAKSIEEYAKKADNFMKTVIDKR